MHVVERDPGGLGGHVVGRLPVRPAEAHEPSALAHDGVRPGAALLDDVQRPHADLGADARGKLDLAGALHAVEGGLLLPEDVVVAQGLDELALDLGSVAVGEELLGKPGLSGVLADQDVVLLGGLLQEKGRGGVLRPARGFALAPHVGKY